MNGSSVATTATFVISKIEAVITTASSIVMNGSDVATTATFVITTALFMVMNGSDVATTATFVVIAAVGYSFPVNTRSAGPVM